VTLGEGGCYFHRQPETAAELDGAVRAVTVSCIGAYRYGGNDPAIVSRLILMQQAGHTRFETTPSYIREAENLREGFGEVFPPLRLSSRR